MEIPANNVNAGAISDANAACRSPASPLQVATGNAVGQKFKFRSTLIWMRILTHYHPVLVSCRSADHAGAWLHRDAGQSRCTMPHVGHEASTRRCKAPNSKKRSRAAAAVAAQYSTGPLVSCQYCRLLCMLCCQGKMKENKCAPLRKLKGSSTVCSAQGNLRPHVPRTPCRCNSCKQQQRIQGCQFIATGNRNWPARFNASISRKRPLHAS